MAQVDYAAILKEAWRQHLAPRGPGAPTVVSLFAGCGGSSLGYSTAGCRELLAAEWDDAAVATFKLNFPDVPVYHDDICKLTAGQCLEMAGLRPGELDLLDGSPPCQGFSRAGRRRVVDRRNQLYMEFARLLRGARPRAFIMENVGGLVLGRMKLIFADIMRELKANGYEVRCWLLDAAFFNTPQSRKRLIWLGVRKDLGIAPSCPLPVGRPLTVRDAFGDCEEEAPPYLSPALAGRISMLRPGQSLCQTHGLLYTTRRLKWGRPAYTLVRGNVGSRACTVHPDGRRAITLAEAKRLGGFPDEFRFAGGYKEGMAQIGDSVPPSSPRSSLSCAAMACRWLRRGNCGGRWASSSAARWGWT